VDRRGCRQPLVQAGQQQTKPVVGCYCQLTCSLGPPCGLQCKASPKRWREDGQRIERKKEYALGRALRRPTGGVAQARSATKRWAEVCVSRPAAWAAQPQPWRAVTRCVPAFCEHLWLTNTCGPRPPCQTQLEPRPGERPGRGRGFTCCCIRCRDCMASRMGQQAIQRVHSPWQVSWVGK
jgi:hypothetical protein